MERPTLQATRREETGTRAAQRLRGEGFVPSVLYGRRRDTVHLTVSQRAFERMFEGGVRMLDLEVGGTIEPALIKDVQYDSMGDHILHVDFSRVALDEKITVTVPVELHGLAKGVTSGGTLDHVVQDIEVSCLPKDLPERIRIEIAEMEIGDILHVGDLEPPPGVEFLLDPDAPVLTIHPPVAAPVAEAAEEVEAEVEAAEPEVIGGRREEKEGEKGSEAKQE